MLVQGDLQVALKETFQVMQWKTSDKNMLLLIGKSLLHH